MSQPSGRLFELGQVVGTPGVLEALAEAGVSVASLLDRHACGDWGNISDEDALLNREAVTAGERILSAYQVNSELRIWVLTEHDRTVTTVLLPDEY